MATKGYPCPFPGCSTVGTYRNNLRVHLMGESSPGHQLRRDEADAIINQIEAGITKQLMRLPRDDADRARLSEQMSDVAAGPAYPAAQARGALREGHWSAVQQLESARGYRQTIDLYAEQLGETPVYLRPTDKGFTVISLDHRRCESMIGVSDRGTGDEYLHTLPPPREHVARACAGYVRKRDSLRRRSGEERFALRCIDHALANGLRLPGSTYCFVHQEWRFGTDVGGGKLDLLAVDPDTGRLAVVELKSTLAKARQTDRDGRDAQQQARHYAQLLYARRQEYYPFFERLARAMAQLHAGSESMRRLSLQSDHLPVAVVWTP